MKDRIRILSSLIAVLTLTQVSAQTPHQVPRLVVTIVVDQLRSDYLEGFAPLYGSGGFRRLMDEGCCYTSASYPMAHVEAASAVASLYAGTTPANHGIVGEQWLDRSTLRPVYCVDDSNYSGLKTQIGSSPNRLGVTTLTDELKMTTNGRALIYSFAPDRDVAVLAAGHAADGAYWINGDTGNWCGTSFYGSLPEWLERCDSDNPLNRRLRRFVYEPLSPEVVSFNYFQTGGINQTAFRHKFIYADQYVSFKTSALVNDEVNRMVKACLDNTRTGQDEITDFLSIGYYAGNFEHASPYEHPVEMQDTYARLDKSLQDLLAILDNKVGLNHTLLVLTSSGCFDREKIDLSRFKISQGTFYINRTSALLNMYFMATYGQGRYVDAIFQNQIYLNHKLLEEKRINLYEAVDKAQEFLMQCSGVREVYSLHRMQMGAWSPELAKLRQNYHALCSGDLWIELAPGWNMVNEDLQTPLRDYQTVADFPLFFLGAQIEKGKIFQPVSIEAVVPTLARFMRIRAPNASLLAPLHGVFR